jgi:hypothetical protein
LGHFESLSRLPTEGDVVVAVEVVEPGFDVLPVLRNAADAIRNKLDRFDVAIRSPFIVAGTSLLNLPWFAFVRS